MLLAAVVANLVLIPVAIWMVRFAMLPGYGPFIDTVLTHAVLCPCVMGLAKMVELGAALRKSEQAERLLLAFMELMAPWPLVVSMTMVVLKLAGVA